MAERIPGGLHPFYVEIQIHQQYFLIFIPLLKSLSNRLIRTMEMNDCNYYSWVMFFC